MKNFLVVRIQGGLGNQMFQYAFGKAAALRNKMDLFFDKAPFNPKKHSAFALDVFDLKCEFADKEILAQVLTPHFEFRKKLWKAIKIPFKYAPTHILEPKFSYNEQFKILPQSAYFDGYWQCEKYFADFADIIKKDFTPREESKFKNNKFYEDIISSNSVAIHIRCGDYVNNARYKKMLYVCGENYFKNAISRAREILENPQFFIFSDDHEYVKSNYRLGEEFKLVQSSCAIEDMYLMQTCRHNIISNSSFSWWAAWLNKNLQKTVIAPSRWATDHSKLDYRDVIPPSWIKVATD